MQLGERMVKMGKENRGTVANCDIP